MYGMIPSTGKASNLNQQQAPQGFGQSPGLSFGGQSPGLGQGASGISPNPLEQQHQMQMMIKALQQGGMR